MADESEWDTDAKVEELKAATVAAVERVKWGGHHHGTKAFYQRWLRARRGDVDGAAKMLERHLQWREEECPWFPALPPLEPLEPAIRTRKAVFCGRARDGSTVVLIRPALHVCSETDVETTRQMVVFVLEHALCDAHAHGSECFTILFDFTDFGYSNFDTDATSFILKMLSVNYPERLANLVILNEGWLFWGLWQLVSPFIDTRTSKKIHMLGAKRDELHALIAPDQLPAEYGGTREFDPTPDDVVASFAAMRGRPVPEGDEPEKSRPAEGSAVRGAAESETTSEGGGVGGGGGGGGGGTGD